MITEEKGNKYCHKCVHNGYDYGCLASRNEFTRVYEDTDKSKRNSDGNCSSYKERTSFSHEYKKETGFFEKILDRMIGK